MERTHDHPANVLPARWTRCRHWRRPSGAGVPDPPPSWCTCGPARSTAAACAWTCTPALRKAGETDERLFAVAAWRETPYFTDAERAALALTEAVTRLADRADPVPDDIWDEAAGHYDDKQLAGARARHRQHQRLEPAQRRHPAGRRRTGLVSSATMRRCRARPVVVGSCSACWPRTI